MRSQAAIPWNTTLLTALAPILWGSTYIVATEILPPDRPLTAAFLRVLPAGLLLTLYCRRLPATGEWHRILIVGTLNIGVFQALLFIAAYRLPGGLAAVIGAIQPLLVMALAWAVDGRKSTKLALAAAIAGVLGMAGLLLAPGATWDAAGVAAALAGAVCMAAGTYFARRWQPAMPVLAFTGWQLLIGGAMLAPFALAFEPPLPLLSGMQVAGYAYLSLAGAMLAYWLWFRGVAILSPVAVSSLGLLSPVTALLLGWLVLGQAIRGPGLLALAVVLGSILIVQWAAPTVPSPPVSQN